MTKYIVVDMSATIIHHGHIRLLKHAASLGLVRVALTTDEEIVLHKGYQPELGYEQRKEILESIRYVYDVVPSPWLLTDKFLSDIGCHLLVHGNDNRNDVHLHQLVMVPRTSGISSSEIRRRASEILSSSNDAT